MVNLFIFSTLFAFVIIAFRLTGKYIRGSIKYDVFRNILFYLPYLSVLLYFGCMRDYFRFPSFQSIYIVLTLIIGVLVLVSSDKSITNILFNKSLLKMFPGISRKGLIISSYGILASVVFEELFYRYFILLYPTTWNIFIVNLLFSFSHYCNEHTRSYFKFENYVRIFLLGLALSYSAILTKSLLLAILGHLLYNLPSLYLVIKRYIFSLERR